MKAKIFLLLMFVSCNGVNSEKNGRDSSKIINKTSELIKNELKVTSNLKQKVLGIWGGDYSENAVFEIRKDSIYNIDQFKTFKYSLEDSTITIFYTDFVYSGKLSFVKDTMVMESDGEKTKFWKFKN